MRRNSRTTRGHRGHSRGTNRHHPGKTPSRAKSLIRAAGELAEQFKETRDAFSPKGWRFSSAQERMAAETVADVLALMAFGGALGFACMALLASIVKTRLAKRKCHKRNAMLLREANAFTDKIAAICGAAQWDAAAYAKATREFDAARKRIDSETAVAPRYRAKRDAEWTRWMKDLAGQARHEEGFPAPMQDNQAGTRRFPACPGFRRGSPIRKLCHWSASPPPTGAAVAKQLEIAKGRGKLEEKIRLGSMLLDAEATVDSSLTRGTDGEITGRNPGLKGWIRQNCPQLLPRYAMLMSCRRMASDFRLAHGVDDPVPAAALLPKNDDITLPERLEKDIAEKRAVAATILADKGVTTTRTFIDRLQAICEARRRLAMEQIREFWRSGAKVADTGGA